MNSPFRLVPLQVKRKTQPTAPAIAPRLLTVPQAAQYLNVGPWAIRSLHWEGTVRGIKIGRRLLFDKAGSTDILTGLLPEASPIRWATKTTRSIGWSNIHNIATWLAASQLYFSRPIHGLLPYVLTLDSLSFSTTLDYRSKVAQRSRVATRRTMQFSLRYSF